MLGNVATLDISLNSLDIAPFPTEFGALSSLVSLNLSGNSFTGSLPTEIGQLSLLGEFLFNLDSSGKIKITNF